MDVIAFDQADARALLVRVRCLCVKVTIFMVDDYPWALRCSINQQ